jgi:predicted nucleic acid-binding protein
MMRVFLDTNVVLDVLGDRTPFVEHAVPIWMLAEKGRITGLVSTLSFSNIFYILRKYAGAAIALKSLRYLRANFTPTACDQGVVDHALASDFPDFEDAIQYFSARNADAACIVTRDLGHFATASIPILSPEQFLATHSFA